MRDLLLRDLDQLDQTGTMVESLLPTLASAASFPPLVDLFQALLDETRRQIQRLEAVSSMLDAAPYGPAARASLVLIEQADMVAAAPAKGAIKDAALIAAMRRIVLLQSASYRDAQVLSRHLGHEGSAKILQDSLDELELADDRLCHLAALEVADLRPNRHTTCKGGCRE